MSIGLKQLAGPGVWGTTWEKRYPCLRLGYAIHTPPRGWHPPRPYIASRQYQQYWQQIIHKKHTTSIQQYKNKYQTIPKNNTQPNATVKLTVNNNDINKNATITQTLHNNNHRKEIQPWNVSLNNNNNIRKIWVTQRMAIPLNPSLDDHTRRMWGGVNWSCNNKQSHAWGIQGRPGAREQQRNHGIVLSVITGRWTQCATWALDPFIQLRSGPHLINGQSRPLESRPCVTRAPSSGTAI